MPLTVALRRERQEHLGLLVIRLAKKCEFQTHRNPAPKREDDTGLSPLASVQTSAWVSTHSHSFPPRLLHCRLTSTLWGKVTSVALQCWTRPWASSCAFKWSAQEKGWEEVKRSRVLILQSAGNSAPSEEVVSDSENGTCWLLEDNEHKN